MLAKVGLTDVAGKQAGVYSLGMSQRLGIARALLGDPPVLMSDEERPLLNRRLVRQ